MAGSANANARPGRHGRRGGARRARTAMHARARAGQLRLVVVVE